jgi:hypothetical protein
MTEEEWLDFQIRFLENDHHYYSITAINIRDRAKKNRLQELKLKRKELQILN